MCTFKKTLISLIFYTCTEQTEHDSVSVNNFVVELDNNDFSASIEDDQRMFARSGYTFYLNLVPMVFATIMGKHLIKQILNRYYPLRLTNN